MKIQKAGRITCAMIAALSVASCDSDDDKEGGDVGGDALANIDFVGFVLANELKSTDDEFFLSLGSFFLNASAVDLGDATETELDLDVCEVDEESGLPFSFSTDSVSAGETVIVSNDAGTLATLVDSAEDGQGFIYSVPEDSLQAVATGPLEVGVGVPAGNSANLTIDIVGDTFPAYQSIPVERAAPMEIISATDDGAGIPTMFSWVAGESIQTDTSVAYVSISLYGENNVSISCEVVDDGSFAIPQEFLDTLTDFSYSYGDIERTRLELFPQERAVLAVTTTSNSIEF
jgi:hypothetical protein